MLTTPFIKENDILKAVGPTTDAIVGTGIGGETVGSVGRVKSVTIGGLTSANPPVHLPTEPAGALDDKSILGIIGGGVWRGYVFTVDYPNSRFLLRPIPGARIPEYDMSGIALITTFEDRHKFTVNRVAKGSPAEEAGIKKGDVITTIDGKPAASWTAERVRNLFTERGRKVKLTLERDGQIENKEITLRPLV